MRLSDVRLFNEHRTIDHLLAGALRHQAGTLAIVTVVERGVRRT
jgi:hypothetical protein